MKFLVVVIAALLHLSSFAGMEPARIAPNSWEFVCKSLNMDNIYKHMFDVEGKYDDPGIICQKACQADYHDIDPKEFREGAQSQSGSFVFYPSDQGSGIGPGLNNQGKFYGKCMCGGFQWGDHAQVPYEFQPNQLVFSGCSTTPVIAMAAAECEQGAPMPSYAPASCYFDSQLPPAQPSACASKAGVPISKMALLGSGSNVAPAGCYSGCEYKPTNIVKIVEANGSRYAAGTYTGSGSACVAKTTPLIDIPSDAAIAGQVATEITQLANKSLLEQIRDKLGSGSTGGGGGGGTAPAPTDSTGYNTGGDIARGATATEAIAAALAASGASAAGLQAEGEAAIDAGQGMSEQKLEDSLPQETWDFSKALDNVKVTVFGAGECPAPVEMFQWDGKPMHFHFDLICQYAIALSALVIAAAGIKAFGIATGG